MKRAILAMSSTASNGALLFAVAVLATQMLSAVEQGFFFAFISFAALVQLSDFGLSYATMQTASHLAGAGRSGEFAAFSARAVRWNLVVATVVAPLVATVGWLVLSTGERSVAEQVSWQAPWGALMLAVFLAQLTVPRIAFREGIGEIEQMWRLRLVQEWASGLACLLALALGMGLGSLAVLWGARALVAVIGLAMRPRRDEVVNAGYPFRRWMTEVWPFQWKIGLSVLSGYLIFRAFPVLVLIEQGPVLAGQFGMSAAMMTVLLAITSAWPLSRAARYGAWIAGGRFGRLRAELPNLIAASTALSVILVATLSGLVWIADAAGIAFAARLTDPVTTAIMLATATLHHVVACFAIPLRAERREPFLWISLFGGSITALIIWLAARYGSPLDIALAYLGCTAAGLVIAYHLFRRRIAQWPALESTAEGLESPSQSNN